MTIDLARETGQKGRRELDRHWQELVWYGNGAWAGDRFVNLKENVLTLEIEAWYEVPNREPVKILSIPRDDFDIHLLCQALHRADNRNVSVTKKLEIVDRHNEGLKMAEAKAMQEVSEEASEQLAHALIRATDPGAPRVHTF